MSSTTSDSGTATTANVMVAFDSNARYEQAVSNIALASGGSGLASNVGFYFGSRVDTGTRVVNTWLGGATEYSYYFAAGGINVEFDKGWRSDGAGISGIYWRVTGQDSFGIANGTVDNNRSGYGSTSSGGAVMLDNAACSNGSGVHFMFQEREGRDQLISHARAGRIYDVRLPFKFVYGSIFPGLRKHLGNPGNDKRRRIQFSVFRDVAAQRRSRQPKHSEWAVSKRGFTQHDDALGGNPGVA